MVVVATLLALSGVASAPAAPVGTASSGGSKGCPKVIVYFSRGSGQPFTQPAGKPPLLGTKLYTELAARLAPEALGSMTNAYTAASVKLPRPHRYRKSVANGVQAALHNVTDLIELCPGSQFVLGGFSQGAQATHTALKQYSSTVAAHIAAVVLFGDPLFNYGDHNISRVIAAGERLRRNREGIALQAHLARAIRIPPAYQDKVLSWCHMRDLVCQGEHLRGPHTGLAAHYTYGNEITIAVERIAKRLPTAASRRRHVTGTCNHGGCALAIWSRPSTSGSSEVGTLREHQQVDVRCQLRGQALSSTNGARSDIWDELDGTKGYVSDLYLDTPGVGVYSSGIPRCPPRP